MTYDEDFAREVLIDHSENPRNNGAVKNYTHHAKALHDAKGEHIEVYLTVSDKQISSIGFTGGGSAVAVASASLMTESVIGKTTEEALELQQTMLRFLANMPDTPSLPDESPELTALAGIRKFPARVSCASLAWSALCEALKP